MLTGDKNVYVMIDVDAVDAVMPAESTELEVVKTTVPTPEVAAPGAEKLSAVDVMMEDAKVDKNQNFYTNLSGKMGFISVGI